MDAREKILHAPVKTSANKPEWSEEQGKDPAWGENHFVGTQRPSSLT